MFDLQDLFVGLCEILCQNTIIYTNLSLVLFHHPPLSRGGFINLFSKFSKTSLSREGGIYGGGGLLYDGWYDKRY